MFKVLIVDDEPIIREGLHQIINWEKYGFTICGQASNGQDALEKIYALHPHLLILDINMPVLDGLELLDLLRQEKRNIQAVILTGYSEFAYAQKALNLGAVGYVLKPIDEEELKKTVRKAYGAILEHSLVEGASQKTILDICWGDTEKELLNNLCRAIDFNNLELIKELLGALHGRYFAADSSIDTMKATYLHLYFAAISQLDLMNRIGEEQLGYYQDVVEEVHRCQNVEELREHMLSKFCQLSDTLVQWSPEGTVNKIIDYVQRHYGEKITLEELSQNLGYTPAYLGKLFTDQLGLRFNTYLGKVRLEKAKDLLQKGLNVSTTAEMVGYNDSDYFNIKFKEEFGVSPSAFKKSRSD